MKLEANRRDVAIGGEVLTILDQELETYLQIHSDASPHNSKVRLGAKAAFRTGQVRRTGREVGCSTYRMKSSHSLWLPHITSAKTLGLCACALTFHFPSSSFSETWYQQCYNNAPSTRSLHPWYQETLYRLRVCSRHQMEQVLRGTSQRGRDDALLRFSCWRKHKGDTCAPDANHFCLSKTNQHKL